MLDAVIVIGLLLLLICGILMLCWGIVDVEYDGFSVKNLLVVLVGAAMLILWVCMLKERSERNHELYIKSHPVEIITTTPARIDTTITIRNGVADTTYTYYLIKK